MNPKLFFSFFLMIINFLKADSPQIDLYVGCFPKSFSLYVPKGYEIQNQERGETLLKSPGGKIITISVDEKGISHEKKCFSQLFSLSLLPNVPLDIMQIGTKHSVGALQIYTVAGALYVVASLPIEKYLEHYLNHPTYKALSPAALEALAICVRTHLTYLTEENKYATWQLKMPQNHSFFAPIAPQVLQAIEHSAHTVLHYQGKTFPSAWGGYYAGETVNYHTLFCNQKGKSPKGVTHLPKNVTKREPSWSFSINAQTFRSAFNIPENSPLQLKKVPKSQKVYALAAQANNQTQTILFVDLQKQLGRKLLKSNHFYIEEKDNVLTFAGVGDGIGVGLCLTTANYMSKTLQYTPEKILQAHFPDTKTYTAYPSLNTPSFHAI